MKCNKCNLWFPSTETNCSRCGNMLEDDEIKKSVQATGFCSQCGRSLGSFNIRYPRKSRCMQCIKADSNAIPVIDRLSTIIEEDEFSHYCPTYMGEGEWE